MPDYAIYGLKGSGKTTLAKILAYKYAQAGVETIVYDPFQEPPAWSSRAVFGAGEENKFISTVKDSTNCAVFVDESGDVIRDSRSERFEKLATRGRHYGHNLHWIVQRFRLLNRTVRSQCEHCLTFFQDQKDAKDLADEYPRVNPEQITRLEKLEFVHCGFWKDPEIKHLRF